HGPDPMTFPNFHGRAIVARICGCILALIVARCHALNFTGVNLPGAEFGSVLPGTYNHDYTYPTAAEINYFIGKGLNTFRLPFRCERVQPSLGAGAVSTDT